MYRKLRKRLTIICAIVIVLILSAMTILSLETARKQTNEKGNMEFLKDVNAMLLYIRSQTIFDYSWFSQMESSNLLIYVEVNEKPLLFSDISHTKKDKELIEEVRECAKKKHDMDISTPPKGKFQNAEAYFGYKDTEGNTYYSGAVTIPIESGFVGFIIIKDKKVEEQQFKDLCSNFILFASMACVLFILLVWFLTGYLIHPLEENQRRQNEFIHAASHELRSPLSVIKASLSMINHTPIETSEHFRDMAEQECTRMSRLVDDMLILAGSDTGSYPIHKEETELEILLLTTYERFERLAKDKKISLTIIPPEEPLPKCTCDKERILQVLAILLDNAINYVPSGGNIRFSAIQIGKEVQIVVADNGPGIAKEDRKKIFDRFYRKEKSRTQKEHFGLGLSIAAEIIELSSGKIFVEETKGGGATFYVVLPISK